MRRGRQTIRKSTWGERSAPGGTHRSGRREGARIGGTFCSGRDVSPEKEGVGCGGREEWGAGVEVEEEEGVEMGWRERRDGRRGRRGRR